VNISSLQAERDATLGDLEQMEQATRGIDELAAALDHVTKTTEQVEAAVADRSANASVLDAQLAVIGEPMARVDEINGSVEGLSAQPLSADQTKQVVAMGDKAKDLRDRLLATKQTIEEWLTLHRDYDHAKQSMTSRVTDLEAETAAIDAKYQQTRPLDEAVEDSRTIQSLLTAVQDERTHVGAVQDIATRLDGRFETANETASFANRVEGLDAHLTVSYLSMCV
jgi:chromosome segregation ATPase